MTLPLRQEYAILLTEKSFRTSDIKLRVDPLKLIASLDNPDEPNELIRDLATLLLPRPLTDQQLAGLKERFIPGLPDYEWTVEYGQYLAGDNSIKTSLENKLSKLLTAMVSMPEFQLS